VASNIEVKRKKGESFEAFFRRFSRRLQQSGKVLDVRGSRYFERAPNKNKNRGSALRRLEMGAKREYLLKTGKVKEEDLRTKKHGR
jgi:ribosomal protein S21